MVLVSYHIMAKRHMLVDAATTPTPKQACIIVGSVHLCQSRSTKSSPVKATILIEGDQAPNCLRFIKNEGDMHMAMNVKNSVSLF